jgi:hypothetical protein
MSEPTSAIRAKAAQIGRLYALGNDADRERRQGGRADAPLEAVADQAWRRANELEDSLAADVPQGPIDALILAGWARVLALHVQDGTPEATALAQVTDRLVTFLENDAGTSLEALGLKAWARTRRKEIRDV